MREIVIFGCPFDRTSSYRRGSRFGPGAIRRALQEIEDYSPFLKKELRDVKFSDRGDLNLLRNNTEEALERIASETRKIVRMGNIPCALGGEHLISLPVVQAMKEKYKNLRVLYIDAHCDLKDTYSGLKFSHATVARRLLELVGTESFFLFGARSGEREEFEFGEKKGILYNFSVNDFFQASRIIKDSPVYLSLDLDIFDPGIFPGTGVPEPGGIGFYDFIQFIKRLLLNIKIAGMDIVELSPPCDSTEASSFLAATVVRELILTAGSRI